MIEKGGGKRVPPPYVQGLNLIGGQFSGQRMFV